MIVNITVGEGDSWHILATLEGPNIDLEMMWSAFNGNIEGSIGREPRISEMIYESWKFNHDAIHLALRSTWEIPETETTYLNTRYFIEFIIKHHGFKKIEAEELYTVGV